MLQERVNSSQEHQEPREIESLVMQGAVKKEQIYPKPRYRDSPEQSPIESEVESPDTKSYYFTGKSSPELPRI